MDTQEQQYVRGFNHGYLLTKHEPNLVGQLAKTLTPTTDYLNGFLSGKEEYEIEYTQDQLSKLKQVRRIVPKIWNTAWIGISSASLFCEIYSISSCFTIQDYYPAFKGMDTTIVFMVYPYCLPMTATICRRLQLAPVIYPYLHYVARTSRPCPVQWNGNNPASYSQHICQLIFRSRPDIVRLFEAGQKYIFVAGKKYTSGLRNL